MTKYTSILESSPWFQRVTGTVTIVSAMGLHSLQIKTVNSRDVKSPIKGHNQYNAMPDLNFSFL